MEQPVDSKPLGYDTPATVGGGERFQGLWNVVDGPNENLQGSADYHSFRVASGSGFAALLPEIPAYR